MQKLRRAWLREVRKIDVQHLVCVDDSGANTAMSRTRARAAKGQRAVGKVPHGHWKTLTLLGALRWEGLVPALRPGDVVAWDNLSSHQAAGVAEAVAAVGARLLPLPPYSFDWSPMEPCWSKVKQRLRTLAARTEATLGKAASEAFSSVTAADARGWFEDHGFCSH